MIDIDDKIVSTDVFEKCFICDIPKCKGICCVEGESGAPLELSEAKKIEEILPIIFDRLNENAKEVIKEHGVSMIDSDGDLTTSILPNSGACVFVKYSVDGIAYCDIEKAWAEGLVDFRKPISCHLYPIRIRKYSSFDAVNYDVWNVCKDARVLGKKENVKVFEFLKDALITKYGQEWYEKLCLAADYFKK